MAPQCPGSSAARRLGIFVMDICRALLRTPAFALAMRSPVGRLFTKRHVRRVVGKVSPSGILVLGDGASFPDQKHGEVLLKVQALPSNLARLSPDATFRLVRREIVGVSGAEDFKPAD